MHQRPVQLSADIVRTIFAEFSTTLSTDHIQQFPWFLGHISSSWRSIFLSMTPHFWRSVAITFSPTYVKDRKDVVRFFLDRDPAALFSFNFSLRDRYSPLTPEELGDIRGILEMLVDESTRWTDVSFYATGGSYLLPLVRAKDRLPLLNSLYLPISGAPEELHSVFQTTPSLTIIDIHELGNWKFDWLKVKQLKIQRIMEAGDANQPRSVNFLPCLTTLYCNPGWLPFLKAPALEDLTLWSCGSDTAVNVKSFVCRSSCNISHLTIEMTAGAMALEAIRNTPHIVYLGLILVLNIDLVFEHLTKSTNPGQEPLACRMVLLDIHSGIYSPDAIQRLYNLILARTSTAADEYGYERFQKLGLMCVYTAGPMKDVITLCERRGIQVCYLPSKSAMLSVHS